MLCVLKNSTPARNFSGNIKKINITHNERNPDEESVVVTMDVDNGKKDTEITITKENLFVIGGGRDAEGNPVFSSKEFNE
ncbi:MAG: hypothetical protein Q7R98_00220 [Candidatus Jorgensenbacteria bacterium]|nr:hypothetical protein [Candidatus Jorgensenbacteria bacterium]